MEEFLSSVGAMALIGVGLYLFLAHLSNKEADISHFKNLLASDSSLVSKFENFWQANKNLSYEQALTKFFSDPTRLSSAENHMAKREEANRVFEDLQKKEHIKQRVYAYTYENFLFSLYSPLAEYSSFYETWKIDSVSSVLPRDYILLKMEEAGYEYPESLMNDWIDNKIIYQWSNNEGFALGWALSFCPNIISESDMNMDKWIKQNGQSMTKQDLLSEISSFQESSVYKDLL